MVKYFFTAHAAFLDWQPVHGGSESRITLQRGPIADLQSSLQAAASPPEAASSGHLRPS